MLASYTSPINPLHFPCADLVDSTRLRCLRLPSRGRLAGRVFTRSAPNCTSRRYPRRIDDPAGDLFDTRTLAFLFVTVDAGGSDTTSSPAPLAEAGGRFLWAGAVPVAAVPRRRTRLLRRYRDPCGFLGTTGVPGGRQRGVCTLRGARLPGGGVRRRNSRRAAIRALRLGVDAAVAAVATRDRPAAAAGSEKILRAAGAGGASEIARRHPGPQSVRQCSNLSRFKGRIGSRHSTSIRPRVPPVTLRNAGNGVSPCRYGSAAPGLGSLRHK